jgi:hypothetical protein
MLSLPVETDEGKHPVLNLIPLARPGRIVTHCYLPKGKRLKY